jgi:predicted phosphate transport protein (TIGR00153 family)
MKIGKRLGFLSRGENHVLAQVLKNLDVSIETSKHLLPLVDDLKNFEYEAVLKESEIISQLEAKADALHVSAVEDVVVGSFFGGIREDILALLEEIDNIADSAKDSSRVFRQRRISESMIEYLFVENVAAFIRACVESTELLREAVVGLEKSKDEVIRLTAAVERKEKEADDLRAKVLENLLKIEVGADVLDVVLLDNFLEAVDGVADHAEHGADVLRILVSKGYT